MILFLQKIIFFPTFLVFLHLFLISLDLLSQNISSFYLSLYLIAQLPKRHIFISVPLNPSLLFVLLEDAKYPIQHIIFLHCLLLKLSQPPIFVVGVSLIECTKTDFLHSWAGLHPHQGISDVPRPLLKSLVRY